MAPGVIGYRISRLVAFPGYGTTIHTSEQPCKNSSSRLSSSRLSHHILHHLMALNSRCSHHTNLHSYFNRTWRNWNAKGYYAKIYNDEKSLRSGRKDLEDIQRECDYNCFTFNQKNKAAQILQELDSVSKNFVLYNSYLFEL